MTGISPEPLNQAIGEDKVKLDNLLSQFWRYGESVESYVLLQCLCEAIHQNPSYLRREEPGVQSPSETLCKGSGSCRDYACLFMEASRRLGLAARFVSGYLKSPPSFENYGATHAWAEVFLPGAGWKY